MKIGYFLYRNCQPDDIHFERSHLAAIIRHARKYMRYNYDPSLKNGTIVCSPKVTCVIKPRGNPGEIWQTSKFFYDVRTFLR